MKNKQENKIIAHRGIHNNLNIPENSIKAFKKAIEKNLPIELDIHILKDNKLVVFHDDNLKRMTGVDKNIEDLSLEELNKIKLLDTDYKIPTFEEILKLVNGKVFLLIELKNDYRYKELCKEVVKYLDNYKGDFAIQSFNPKIIKWFKKNRPNYTRGLLLTNNKNKILNRLLKSKVIFNYCSPNFLSISKKIINDKKIKKYKENNVSILVWTINKDNNLEDFKNKVDACICNITN